MAGTVTASVVKNDTTSPPQFQNSAGTEIGTLCRAWVNFNGTGTVAIRSSFNVSSITDNGVGDYTVNFTTAMPDGNYCYKIQSQVSATATTTNTYNPTSGTPAAASLQIKTWSDTAAQDNAIVCVAVFR